MFLIIDGGGTSTKAYLSDGKKIISTFKSNQGNVIADFNIAKDSFVEIITAANKIAKNVPLSIVIFCAGYYNLPINKKELLKKTIEQETSCKSIRIHSDSMLQLYTTNLKTVSLTLGTGTSIVHNTQGEPEVLFGFGHLIKDPLSGYALAQNIIFNVLSQGNELQKNELFKIYGVKSQSELIAKIYNNPAKTTISDKFEELSKSKLLSKFTRSAFDVEGNFLFTKNVISIFKKAEIVILNGSVANSQLTKRYLKKIMPGIKFAPSHDKDKTISLIIRNYKW